MGEEMDGQSSSANNGRRAAGHACSDTEAVGLNVLDHYGSRTKLAAIGLVTSAVIREFNDPLQAIGNILGGIHRRGTVEAEDLDLVTLAYEELQKLNVMVRDLQEFCQPGREGREPLDVAVEIGHFVETSRAVMGEHNITLEAETEGELPPVHAEAKLIRWVFEELFVKLIDSCDDGSVLCIRVFAAEDTVSLEISEKGCGLDPETMKRFLDAFKKGGKQAISSLWLTICTAIVAVHGGRIEVGSTDGTGTLLRLSLPVAAASSSTGG